MSYVSACNKKKQAQKNILRPNATLAVNLAGPLLTQSYTHPPKQ